MKTIELTRGKVAIVDDDDYDRVSKYKWFSVWDGHNWYAATGHGCLKLHRFIMEIDNPKIEIDHIDGDGLNCQRENMRECGHAQNLRNRGLDSNNTSGFKGVSVKGKKWRAYIGGGGRQKYIGTFDNPTSAALAYDRAAKELYGEFAQLNFTEA